MIDPANQRLVYGSVGYYMHLEEERRKDAFRHRSPPVKYTTLSFAERMGPNG